MGSTRGTQVARPLFAIARSSQRFGTKAPPAIGYHPPRMKPMLATSLLFTAFVLSAIGFAQESTPQNLPYAAVHNPEFISAAAATFMNTGDRVIGLMGGKTAKAYPAGILAQHGLVEDETPSGPIAVTW
jgi:hypothetical protein